MFYVYIIRSLRDKKFYTGFTKDLDKRLLEHNRGKSSTKTTFKKGPFELMHVELVETREEARGLEKYLKSGSGRETRDEIVR